MIRLQNVTKVYDGSVVAAKDVSLDIAKGEFVFLVGPSGSGKSTLIRLMMREERPTNGDIWVAGKHASDLASWKVPHLRRSIGTVFQDFKLLPHKTVYENVAFALEVTGRPRSIVRNQVPQVLKLVGLSAKADRYPRQLSGGEQQRVSVARAFVNRPLIVFADEPTGNLDPATSVGIMRILDRINRTGTTVVMATHDHAIVDAMRRRVVQLDRGRVVRDQSRGVYERRAERVAEPATAEEVEVVAPAEVTAETPPEAAVPPQPPVAEPPVAEPPVAEDSSDDAGTGEIAAEEATAGEAVTEDTVAEETAADEIVADEAGDEEGRA
jgi:cell division transport system ATP-binding protein